MKLVEKLGLAALHQLDPELAHDISLRALSTGLVPLAGSPFTSERLRTNLAGLDLPNPVGLAAGYDKNAKAVAQLMRAGFGFIELGAVTPRAQPGNPKPRLFRLSEDSAVINRFGFNNHGAGVIASRLASRPPGIPVGLNIGANKDSNDRSSDFVAVIKSAGATADFLTINVSSPNTERLRSLQGASALAALLDGVIKARDSLAVHRPVFLKIAPDLSDREIADIAAIAIECRIDGIIATNTTLSRDGLSGRHAQECGGLSGQPLFKRSTIILAKLYQETKGNLPLIGVGGVSSVEDAWQKIRAGASAVQIYSALIYNGFSVVNQVAKGLDKRLFDARMSMEELCGTGVSDWVQV